MTINQVYLDGRALVADSNRFEVPKYLLLKILLYSYHLRSIVTLVIKYTRCMQDVMVYLTESSAVICVNDIVLPVIIHEFDSEFI